MMPKDAAAKLAANDSSLTKVEFVNNSVFQMKSAEYAQKIADGLRGNTHCKEVIIDKCSLMDPGAVLIAEALKENTSVERLMLPNNKLGPLSLIAIAECLKVNNTIKEFGLLGNSGSAGGKWGDASLTLLIEALEGGNTALTKIVWRLDNRLSWKITKLMSRNVELQRRRAAGMDVTDIDPRLTAKKVFSFSFFFFFFLFFFFLSFSFFFFFLFFFDSISDLFSFHRLPPFLPLPKTRPTLRKRKKLSPSSPPCWSLTEPSTC